MSVIRGAVAARGVSLPLGTANRCSRGRRGLPVRNVVVASASKPYMKNINPFRDSWVMVKEDGTELKTEFADVNDYLIESGLSTEDAVRPRDVQQLVEEEGYTLVDVRIQWSYDEWHLQQAVHVPLQREIEGNGPAKVWRKFGHALFVEFPPMESNQPNWLEDMLAQFKPEDKILIGCNMGGLLDEDPVKRVSSSSFEALYYLKNAGFTNLKYIKGGFCSYRESPRVVARTKGVVENLPWFKKMKGVSEFFPAPCNWNHVRRCACDDADDEEECTCSDSTPQSSETPETVAVEK